MPEDKEAGQVAPTAPPQGMRAPANKATQKVGTDEISGDQAIAEEAPAVDFDPLTDIDWVTPPSEEQIAAWKQQFGEVHFMKFINNIQFHFRNMTRRESKQLAGENISAEEKEDKICQAVTLWPAGIDFSKAFAKKLPGIPSTYVEFIYDRSGFIPVVELKNA